MTTIEHLVMEIANKSFFSEDVIAAHVEKIWGEKISVEDIQLSLKEAGFRRCGNCGRWEVSIRHNCLFMGSAHYFK